MITVAMAIEDKTLWADAHSCLQREPVLVDFRQSYAADLNAFIADLARTKPDLVLIDLALLQGARHDVMPRIRIAAPGARIIGLRAADGTTSRDDAPEGVDEYLSPPLAEGLKQAVRDRESVLSNRGNPGGKTISFLSAKGGCGATTLACHVALDLSRLFKGVLLADLDVNSGMVAFLMQSKFPYTLADVLNHVQRLDASYWKALVAHVTPDLDVISAPPPMSAELMLKRDEIRQVLAFVSGQYRWSVADAGRGISPYTLAVLEATDEVCLVTTPEIPALHQAKEMLQQLRGSGYRQDRIRLVLNRLPKHSGIGPEEVQNMMGIPLYAVLPDSYPELHDALAHGQTLTAETDLGRQLSRLARKLAGVAEQTSKRKSPFWIKAS